MGAAIRRIIQNTSTVFWSRSRFYIARKLESLSWVPYDYEKIRSDGYLANLSRTRLTSFRLFVLPNFEATIEAIREILDEIESELDD